MAFAGALWPCRSFSAAPGSRERRSGPAVETASAPQPPGGSPYMDGGAHPPVAGPAKAAIVPMGGPAFLRILAPGRAPLPKDAEPAHLGREGAPLLFGSRRLSVWTPGANAGASAMLAAGGESRTAAQGAAGDAPGGAGDTSIGSSGSGSCGCSGGGCDAGGCCARGRPVSAAASAFRCGSSSATIASQIVRVAASRRSSSSEGDAGGMPQRSSLRLW
mmetsp:Transcript_1949/g.4872  ORF Transcript_1949/g.4872 Transcript_1949/m.4872 type:complete len:218 (+) Transcript_1949:382-1035(+)